MNYTDITQTENVQTDIVQPSLQTDNKDLYELKELDPVIEPEKPNDSICVLPSPEPESIPNTDGKYFSVDNLLSELQTDFQKQTARLNLGIADKYTMTWGNITGNLVNQADMYGFIKDQAVSYGNLIIGDLNKSLDYFDSLIKDMAEGINGNVILLNVSPDHRIYSDEKQDVRVDWMYTKDV